MSDASFEDGAERPLRLVAADADDVTVISSLLQDAVFTAGDIRWDRRRRELALLVHRFRWEDRVAAEARGRGYERVQTVLAIGDVLSVSSQGVDRHDRDLVMALLALSFEPGEEGGGAIVLTLSGDGAIRAVVECVNLTLHDVTRPYLAPSGRRPEHPE